MQNIREFVKKNEFAWYEVLKVKRNLKNKEKTFT